MTFKSIFARACFAVSMIFASTAHAGFFDNIVQGLDQLEAKNRLTTYNSVLDKPLVDHFYTISEDGKDASLSKRISSASGFKFHNLNEGSLTVRKLYFTADNLSQIAYEMREFRKSPLDDEMGKEYVAFANSRGNIVQLYRPAMGETLNRMFDQHFEFKPAGNVANFVKAENALIEVAPNGKVVSFMMRAHQAIHNFTTRSYQYVTIVFGKDYMQFFENKVPNSAMNENFLRVVTASEN